MFRVAIVTGGARGIGFAIARALIREAYMIVLVDINESLGQNAADQLYRTTFMKCDVSSREEFKAVFQRTKDRYGRIDLLVNNAAILDEHNPKRTVEVNLTGPIHGCELAIEYMGTSNGGRGGCVINVSSTTGLIPYADAPTYVATKHALIGLTRSYGHPDHFEKNGVTFMAACPHYAHTDLLMEAVPLGIYNNVYIDAMPADVIAAGVVDNLLGDKRNGSVLIILHDGRTYAEIPEDLKSLLQ